MALLETVDCSKQFDDKTIVWFAPRKQSGQILVGASFGVELLEYGDGIGTVEELDEGGGDVGLFVGGQSGQ